MANIPQTHKVDIVLENNKTYSLFVKHGQTLLDAVKELEKMGIVKMVYSQGFPYIISVNGEVAGVNTNTPMPWYGKYDIDSNLLNGKENMGYEYWLIDGEGRKNVPVTEYEGKKYFPNLGDIIITNDFKIGIGKNEGGISEFDKNGEAITTHAQKEGIWSLNEINGMLGEDKNAFLTPVDKIEYGWIVREDILHPNLKNGEKNSIGYKQIELYVAVPKWNIPKMAEKKETPLQVAREMPAILAYQKKLLWMEQARARRRLENLRYGIRDLPVSVPVLRGVKNFQEENTPEEYSPKSLFESKQVSSKNEEADRPDDGLGNGGARLFCSDKDIEQDLQYRAFGVERYFDYRGETNRMNMKMREEAGEYIGQKESEKQRRAENKTTEKNKQKTFGKIREREEKKQAARISPKNKNSTRHENIRAVIFDLDGVLSDSEKIHLKTFNRVFEKYGVKQIKLDYWLRTYTGKGSEFIIEDIIEKNKIENADAKEIMNEREEIFAKLIIKGEVKPVLGSKALVKLAKKKKLKIIVASGGHRKHVKAQLSALGLEGVKFLGMEDVKKRKPAPDVFLKAAKVIGIKPENCLVIEDAASGFEAAKKAGMRCVLIGAHHPKELKKKAELWLSKISLPRIKSLFAKAA